MADFVRGNQTVHRETTSAFAKSGTKSGPAQRSTEGYANSGRIKITTCVEVSETLRILRRRILSVGCQFIQQGSRIEGVGKRVRTAAERFEDLHIDLHAKLFTEYSIDIIQARNNGCGGVSIATHGIGKFEVTDCAKIDFRYRTRRLCFRCTQFAHQLLVVRCTAHQ